MSATAGPSPLTPPRDPGRDTVLLGRAARADFRIGDPTVSATHAMLRRSAGGEWTISDLGSRNGTRVNGWRVHETALRPGDLISLGLAEFTFLPD